MPSGPQVLYVRRMRTRLGRAVRTTYRGTTGEIKLQQIQGQIKTLSSASSAEAKRVEVMHGRLAACLDRSVELAQDDAKLSAKLEPKAGDCAENGRSEALA